jgi:transmembrane sensor
MSRNDIAKLLARYLEGQTTPTENELLEHWLEHNELNNNWKSLDEASREEWLNSLFTDIENRISYTTKVIKRPEIDSLVKWAAMAAVFLVFLALTARTLLIKNEPVKQTSSQLKIPLKENQNIVLNDGSKVWANSGATLRYQENFNVKTREVFLTGEAYFDVKHQPSKPFLVHTGKIDVTVLGTAFNIKSDGGSNKVIVTVTRGRVKVTEGNKLIGFLTPNQQVIYNTANNQYSQTAINAAEVIKWLEKDMNFNNVTFGQAAEELQERFKITIRFQNDKVKGSIFSGTAPKGNDLEDILNVLCAFNHAGYKKQADGSILIFENNIK